jgi:hypothetical protein
MRRMAPYEQIATGNYGDSASILRLQEIESDMIGTAAHRLVLLQEDMNSVAAEIDRKTAFRTSILSVGNSVMYIIAIILLFAKTAKIRDD